MTAGAWEGSDGGEGLDGDRAGDSDGHGKRSRGRPAWPGLGNAASTRLERNPRYGATLVMTEAEARKVEAKNQAQIDLGNKPTDPKAKVTDLPADCSGGRGVDCNYNAAWTDPGSVVMRVNGQPRNGFITTTADGRVPMRKDVHVARFG